MKKAHLDLCDPIFIPCRKIFAAISLHGFKWLELSSVTVPFSRRTLMVKSEVLKWNRIVKDSYSARTCLHLYRLHEPALAASTDLHLHRLHAPHRPALECTCTGCMHLPTPLPSAPVPVSCTCLHLHLFHAPHRPALECRCTGYMYRPAHARLHVINKHKIIPVKSNIIMNIYHGWQHMVNRCWSKGSNTIFCKI